MLLHLLQKMSLTLWRPVIKSRSSAGPIFTFTQWSKSESLSFRAERDCVRAIESARDRRSDIGESGGGCVPGVEPLALALPCSPPSLPDLRRRSSTSGFGRGAVSTGGGGCPINSEGFPRDEIEEDPGDGETAETRRPPDGGLAWDTAAEIAWADAEEVDALAPLDMLVAGLRAGRSVRFVLVWFGSFGLFVRGV
ncbi:unnamed protein product [Pseudo-nitzschia multistriata]|uniref:Uncharacterized protein n=1 Tax=Pseudo-nitzschia multistriata TaxID=183589 RepID=A0A448ZBJ3_9STRA|nr:unnamed protein product [Pseudo-nitzschia multistriata]